MKGAGGMDHPAPRISNRFAGRGRGPVVVVRRSEAPTGTRARRLEPWLERTLRPAAVQGANRPKLGAGLSPSFEPSSASLEWVRERVGGGSVRAWKLGTPRHLGSALSRPRSSCGPAGRSLGIGAARGRGVFNQTGENSGPGQPHGARGLDRWCPNLSAPPACAPWARRTYDGAGARQAHARHPSPIAEDPPPSWRGAPWWIVRAYARLG